MARRDDRRDADQVWASPGTGENAPTLRTLALAAVVVGLVALTTAACVLSYSSVHDFALRAGISRSLAKIYPDIGDAMLVMAGCSVLALRGAGLISKVYGWVCFMLLLGVLAASSVVHEAGLNMPLRSAEITAAVFPWALVLVAFGLLLALLRHARRRRQSQRATSAPADALESSRAAIEPPALKPPALEAGESGAYEAGYEAGYDVAVYEGAGEYDEGEPYDYIEPAPAEPSVVSPTVPYPRLAVEPDDAAAGSSAPPEAKPPEAKPPKAGPRPTEMQLRARTPRQPEPADTSSAQSSVTQPQAIQPPTPARSSATEPPTSGFTGDTIPHGELNPAPTSDQASSQPPELDRPRSSPTPPS